MNCSNIRAGQNHGTGNGAGLFSWHVGGAHVVMCDGAVRFINQNVGASTLIAIITAFSNDIVGDF